MLDIILYAESKGITRYMPIGIRGGGGIGSGGLDNIITPDDRPFMMSGALPIQGEMEELRSFLQNRALDTNLSSHHREYLKDILNNTIISQYLKSFLISLKLNLIALSDNNTSELSYWIVDFQAFTNYLTLKDISIEDMSKTIYIHYQDYKLFLHFLSHEYGNMGVLKNNEMDKEAFYLYISEFHHYPLNNIILKMLPFILIEPRATASQSQRDKEA